MIPFRTVARQYRHFCFCLLIFALILGIASRIRAQDSPIDSRQNPFAQLQEKYPGLLEEFGYLAQAMQREVQLPPARTRSQLLPMLPESTIFYLAIPNYGEASHQALGIFQARLKQSPVLREWWEQGETKKLKIEDGLEKFYQLSQFLGEEIIVAGDRKQGQNFLILAKVRKPGLKSFLQKMAADSASDFGTAVNVLDIQQLATAKDSSKEKLAILVCPDLVVAAPDVAALRSFNARPDSANSRFASTPFGQRLMQAYNLGTSVVAGVDVQAILHQIPSKSVPNDTTFQRSGFADMKYLVWEYRNVPGEPTSQAELSFNGPRRGIASWLAAPAPLGSLDFVSAEPVLSATLLLKDPAQIFDELKDIASASKPDSFAGLSQMEQAMKLSLKEDLLRLLAGEITVEVVKLEPPEAVWKVILKVKDPARLQATINTLLAGAPANPRDFEQDGITYHTLTVPSRGKALEIGYAFVDGYLVIGSSAETLREAVRLHQSGESLARSGKFQSAIPAGRSAEASAVFYQDPTAMSALAWARMAPEMAASLAQASGDSHPNIMWMYGEDTALRQVSSSGGASMSAALIVGAIAIPNLVRARTSANDAGAVSTLRTIAAAQTGYFSAYPMRGFARTLAALGPDPMDASNSTPAHAGFIDSGIGNSSCVYGTWCEKSGFRYTMKAVCKMARCTDFVAVGTPVSAQTGAKNFCVTSDGIVRFSPGPSLTLPTTASECRSWPPLQ